MAAPDFIDNPAEIVSYAVLIVLLGWLGIAAWRDRRLWSPYAWADRFDLDLTDRNAPIVRSYILRTRILRGLGAAIGFLGPWIYAKANGLEFVFYDLRLVLIGYLAGAVVAELTIRRPRADVPTASLAPREVGAYLPHRFRKALWGTALLAVLLYSLYLIVPLGTDTFARRGGFVLYEKPRVLRDSGFLVWTLPSIVVIVMVVELLQRYIVGRPQPAVSSDLIEADKAIRSASLHALAGAGVGLELMVITGELMRIIYKTGLPMLVFAAVGFASLGAAVAAWIHIARGGQPTAKTVEQAAQT